MRCWFLWLEAGCCCESHSNSRFAARASFNREASLSDLKYNLLRIFFLNFLSNGEGFRHVFSNPVVREVIYAKYKGHYFFYERFVVFNQVFIHFYIFNFTNKLGMPPDFDASKQLTL